MGRKVTQVVTVQPGANSLDVIMIVDDSGSMKADNTKLAQRMSTLLDDLDAINIDYQVCITTTDLSSSGAKGSPLRWQGLNSFIMTKSSPNRSQVFVNTIDAIGADPTAPTNRASRPCT